MIDDPREAPHKAALLRSIAAEVRSGDLMRLIRAELHREGYSESAITDLRDPDDTADRVCGLADVIEGRTHNA